MQGYDEVLVVWKPSWIPIRNVLAGHVLSKFVMATKCRYNSVVGKLILPVEPESTLAKDIATVSARMESDLARYQERQAAESSGSAAVVHPRGTPRKSLGSVAKKAAPHKKHETQKL